MTKKKQPTSSERRQFTRMKLVGKVQLFSGTGLWSCDIIDISLKGVLISKPDDWAGNPCDIFRLAIAMTNSPDISMNIEIVHVGKKTFGAQWNKIDVGSFSRLKRLLELNTKERNQIFKEISFL